MENKKEYKIAKYFDTYFEYYVTELLTKEEAEKAWNNIWYYKQTELTSYEIREI